MMSSPNDNENSLSNGLPFVVTHWLANFQGDGAGEGTASEEQRLAVEKIRKASAEIASAFSTLGSFGKILPPSFSGSLTTDVRARNATYSDVRRQWSGLPTAHLEQIAKATAATNEAVENGCSQHVNLIDAVNEGGTHGGHSSDGRTIQDAIEVADENETSEPCNSLINVHALSVLQTPSLVTPYQTSEDRNNLGDIQAERPASPPPSLHARSGYVELGKATSEKIRRLLELRDAVQFTRNEIKSLDMSIAKQAETVSTLDEKYKQLESVGTDMTRMLEVLDEVKSGKQECDRVTAQLQRKLVDLSKTLGKNQSEMSRLETEVKNLEARRRTAVRSSHDPHWSWPGKLARDSRVGGNPLLKTVISRQMGFSKPRRSTMPPVSSVVRGRRSEHFVANTKALLSSRLSHAATINAHMSYPVYCLRFDKTGQYFISGADDYLIKVFHLGSGPSCHKKKDRDGSGRKKCNYGANVRGAVLVCSLRGHAGVINDIDVSSDNSFLATASVDGDVRVWGLKDGCPVAILRGHKGGANMVSWSKLTPYRLISTGCDGYARIWDIREACLTRYGAFVGNRPEYQIQLSVSERLEIKQYRGLTTLGQTTQSEAPLPALPVRESSATDQPEASGPSAALTENAPNRPENEVPLVIPPLPAAVPPLPGDAIPNNVAEANGEIQPPGQFVANDEIDEGVKLLAKLKHGSTGHEVAGPGTRSRRSAVNVICVARCPLGLYFATGSDDGICRVFEDCEEPGVLMADERRQTLSNGAERAWFLRRSKSSQEPVLNLMGHVSAITDLSFSNRGDRLLSGSQKDGVFRIWSLQKGMLKKAGQGSVAHILIKLTNPKTHNNKQTRSARRTHGISNRIEGSKVSCDVAVWTHDDAMVVTSQCVLVKQSGSEIHPGSQYIFLWDSRTGQCLLGISGAHTMQCPVVVPHPCDSSLLCTAGADGFAKLWDLESGRCVFCHANKLDFGPIEASERGSPAGYLDGSFNMDGTMIVLTDDSGRLTILDANAEQENPKAPNSEKWMQEQYFANDYYELFYDRNGYCIERGSERPPHLAPRGVRCSHGGSPWSDEVNEIYSKLSGPLPLPIHVSMWQRAEIRRKSLFAVERGNDEIAGSSILIRRGVREYNPNSTILIKASGHVDDTDQSNKSRRGGNGQGGERTTGNAIRAMSSNFRYLDYDDMIRIQDTQDDEAPDSEDEEFNPTARNGRQQDDSDEELDDEMENELVDSNSNRPSRSNNTGREQRARRRSRAMGPSFVDLGSDDEMEVEQIVSTNNHPSGPFIRDYTEEGHIWRLPSGGTVISKWLRRYESDTSYEGRKTYTPQLGDSVVYIPRAHYDTIKCFPSLVPPWQHWPEGTEWPVVQCCVRGVRFRFPYEDYYRSSGHKSLVAILTLEVTGIPEISHDREFPWPKPSFVESTNAFVFELSLFQNDEDEFIFPEGLYIERVKAFEDALRQRNSPSGLDVTVYFEERSREDAAMEASQGIVDRFIRESDPASSIPHLHKSGFGVVRVSFGNDYTGDFSPWGISMQSLSISRPHLSDEDKTLVLEQLNSLTRNESLAQHFNTDVDPQRYCDYRRMVEVGMCLVVMKRRLREDYYGSKFGVVQDMRLIRDNCIKYNGSEHELAVMAKQMCDDFESKILNAAESDFLRESDLLVASRDEAMRRRPQTTRLNLPQRTTRVVAQNHHRNRSQYREQPRRLSSLERLPAPEQPLGAGTRRGRVRVAPPARSGRRTRSMADASEENEDEGSRRQFSTSRHEANIDSLARLGNSDGTGNEGAARMSTRRTRSSVATSSEVSAGGFRADTEDQVASSRRATRSCPSAFPPAQPSNGEHRTQRSTRSRVIANTANHDDIDVDASDSGSSVSSVADESDFNENDRGAAPPPTRTSAASRSSLRTKRSRSTPAATSYNGTSRSPARKSRRTRAKQTQSYEDLSSDFEPEDEDAQESEDESEAEVPKARSSSRKVQSYAELPSDYDEDENDEDDDKNAHRSTKKRKRKASPASSRSKKPKKKATELKEKVSLKPWPRIPMKDITPVSHRVLELVAEEDENQVFAIPVIETYSDIANAYLELVPNPIDLRTIYEERIPQYQTIKELQEDLLLMFDNCCLFNEANSDLGQYAMAIRNKTNELFLQACEKEGVSLGRWRP